MTDASANRSAQPIRSAAEPPRKTLVLAGGGHAHVEVLRRFARRRPDIRVVLISATPRMLYSGMLPGVIRGEYRLHEASVDLALLAAGAGAEMVVGEALAIDLASRRVEVAGVGPIGFDLLSLDLGGRQTVAGSAGIAVKPIEPFMRAWAALEPTLAPDARVVVVGAGPAGVELTLALAQRPSPHGTACQATSRSQGAIHLTLVGNGPEPLADAPPRARRLVRSRLLEAGVCLVSGVAATHATDGRLHLSDGGAIAADAVLWAGGVVGPALLAAAGLACDESGCVRVDHCLRSLSHPFVFASGDCAALPEARSKAGVWAVRAGAPLARNLRRAAGGATLKPWRPQRSALVILGLGDHHAVAWRNGIVTSGGWVWTWKDWIDRRWIRRYLRAAAPRD